MPFSTLAAGPHIRSPLNDDDDRRTLDLDGQQVSSSFYDPILGGDELAVIQSCPLAPIAREFGASVRVRATPSAIVWMPASRKAGPGETDAFARFAATLPNIAREPAWFSRAAYAKFLKGVGLDAEKVIAAIPPPDPRDSERIVRHAYLRFFNFGRLRLPAWKEISAIVLTRELKPPSPDLEAGAMAAEAARRSFAVIEDAAETPPEGAVMLVEHIDLTGFPEFHALALVKKGDSLETWAPVGRGCWGKLSF